MNHNLQRLLDDAAWDGDHVTVAALITRPDVDPAAHHSTALLHAAHRGHWRCVEILIPVSNPFERKSEALYRAARGAKAGHRRCVYLLSSVSVTHEWESWQWDELPPWSVAILRSPMTSK